MKLITTEQPYPITYDNSFYQGITLNLYINPNVSLEKYWIVKGNDGNSTFSFYVVSDKYISQLFGFSVNSLYIGHISYFLH